MDIPDYLWIGSPSDIRTEKAAEVQLQNINDSQFSSNDGIAVVSTERWKLAQEFESKTWLEHARSATTDRDDEHAHHFDQYKALPYNLGTALEIGCGPFTQLASIIYRGHTANSVTLVDPLLSKYLDHPNCRYKHKFCDIQNVDLISACAEDFKCNNYFDSIVCINVLEHVRDAFAVMANIKSSLRHNGLFVFHERSWDNIDLLRLYDVGHPIRLKYNTIINMLSGFDLIFNNEIDLPHGRSIYIIGRKL